jgi:hypothetical protein
MHIPLIGISIDVVPASITARLVNNKPVMPDLDIQLLKALRYNLRLLEV